MLLQQKNTPTMSLLISDQSFLHVVWVYINRPTLNLKHLFNEIIVSDIDQLYMNCKIIYVKNTACEKHLK